MGNIDHSESSRCEELSHVLRDNGRPRGLQKWSLADIAIPRFMIFMDRHRFHLNLEIAFRVRII